MDTNMQLTIYSFRQLFSDKIFFPDISLIFSKIPDNCQIPWHFQVFQTSGHPAYRVVQKLRAYWILSVNCMKMCQQSWYSFIKFEYQTSTIMYCKLLNILLIKCLMLDIMCVIKHAWLELTARITSCIHYLINRIFNNNLTV